MFSAASQTLAELLTQEITSISQEQISFEHPRLWQQDKPGINLYCYHVQEVNHIKHSNCRWFELKFLIIATDHTRLGEQNLLSSVLVLLSQYSTLPDTVLDRTLQGWGAVEMKVFTPALGEDMQFWSVLCTPLQLALHVRLTVPQPLLLPANFVA